MTVIESEIVGMVWKVMAQPGQRLAAGDVVVVLESMKMEIPVESPCAGVVASIAVTEGDPVAEGTRLASIDPAVQP